MQNQLVFIRGAGDIATGVAIRLYNCGFDVVMSEIDQPTTIRRSVAFSEAVFAGQSIVEGVKASFAESSTEALRLIEQKKIAIIIDGDCQKISQLQPHYLVDAILAKRNCGTTPDMAPITIALGPGFAAPEDCHAVIETNRGHHLGRVIYQGRAQENTGIPGEIAGYSHQRVIHAEHSGVMSNKVKLGDLVKIGQSIAFIDDYAVLSPLDGMVRGLLHDGLPVQIGLKISDIDPRGKDADYLSVSDKARSIAGGVLEAMLHFTYKQQRK